MYHVDYVLVGALTHFPCKLRLKNFFHRPGECRCTHCSPLATPMDISTYRLAITALFAAWRVDVLTPSVWGRASILQWLSMSKISRSGRRTDRHAHGLHGHQETNSCFAACTFIPPWAYAGFFPGVGKFIGVARIFVF